MKIKDLKALIKDLPDSADVFVFGRNTTQDLGVFESIVHGASSAYVSRVKKVNGNFLTVQRPCLKTAGAKKALIIE
jgi:hypothetical protein